MYYPIEKGTVEVVDTGGYKYNCQLPPVGYGKNRITGEVQYVGVRASSTKKADQVWKPLALPTDFKDRRKKEILRQKSDESYYDPELEKVRHQWWLHRLCGEWIKINGKEIYVPPAYWVYLNTCYLDIGLPTYRDTDRRFFYVWSYCVEDPFCGGLVDIERRRMGKTFKSGSIILDRTSISSFHHGGIQSKTNGDAKQVFLKTVVNFFKKWPDFFRPIYDQSKGVTPTSELRFFQTVVKGKRAEEVLEGEELESWIDYGSSDIYFYDGSKLNTYVMDEFGKTQECSVWDRWNVVRFCLDQDGEWCGKALLTSTIEDMESGGEDAKMIWDASDPNQRDANGRTKSGLYRIFFPAYETTFFDKYGYPEIEKGRLYYLNQREGLKNDERALSSIIRKNPFTIEEAFRIDGEKCMFNAMKLNEQRDLLSWNDNFVERGNFEWENGVRDSKVVWQKNRNGRWQIIRSFVPPTDEVNNVTKRGSQFFPNNNWRFGSAVDPYDHDVTVDKRRSNGASLVKQKANFNNYKDPLIGAYICRYLARPQTAAILYEDMIKQCFYFSCSILVEDQKPNIINYFKDRGYEAFLMVLPGNDKPGISSSPKNKQMACDLVEATIENDIDKVFFIDLIDDWLKFDINKTEPFDLGMASLWTEIACANKLFRHKKETPKTVITDIIRTYQIPQYG